MAFLRMRLPRYPVSKWTAVTAEGKRRHQAKHRNAFPSGSCFGSDVLVFNSLKGLSSPSWSVLCFISFTSSVSGVVSSEKPMEGLVSRPPAPCSGARGLCSELCCGSSLVTVARDSFYSRVRYPHRSRSGTGVAIFCVSTSIFQFSVLLYL